MLEILWKDRQVGYAQVKQEGLYYRFSCACTPPDGAIYRIYVSDGKNRRDLGICVPKDGEFVLNTRVPCKYINGENLSFELSSEKQDAISVPIKSGESFAYLDQLETARLRVTNGQPEIVIDPVPNPQDSDQNQEYPNRSAWQ